MGGRDTVLNLLRALAHTAAGVWLGGIILIAIVAQTTFSEMRNSGVESPNALAGQVMSRNFGRFNVVQIGCAAALLLWQGAALALCRRRSRDWFRFSLIVAAVALLAYYVIGLTPKIVDLQPLLAQPDAEEALRAAFQEFHRTAVRVSRALLVVVAAITIEMALPMARHT